MGKVLYWALYNHILPAAWKNRQGILCNAGLHDLCLENVESEAPKAQQ